MAFSNTTPNPASAARNFDSEPRADGSTPSDALAIRASELPKLIALWPHEAADVTRSGRLRVIAKLHRALRCERRRGLAGHWAYDLARHHQLLAAYRQETTALTALRGESPHRSLA